MTLKEKIDFLVKSDIEAIHQELNQYGDSDWLYDMLADGWIGYNDMTIKELDFEYNHRIN